MIEFEFQDVTAGWWEVTAGRSLDDVEYVVRIDGTSYQGRYCRVEQIVQLYECAVLQIPTAAHPMDGVYALTENDDVSIHVAEHEVPTSYDELEATVGTFLAHLFEALDRQSAEGEVEAAIDYLDALDGLQLDFREVYAELRDTAR